MHRLVLVLSIILIVANACAQSLPDRYASYGNLIVTGLPTAPFPHPSRESGHTYNGTLYTAAEHYHDSTVAIFVPRGFHPGPATNLVVHFHGWFNNVDSVLSQYRLIEQFSASRVNAILVVPQGPRNAPDSYGGRLEDEGGFKRFVDNVMSVLRSQHIVRSTRVGKIVLAGHSGAYHAISYILMRGGMTPRISDVFLFDALYGQTEKYVHWIDAYRGRLRVIYTEQGGTKEETGLLMEDLKGWHVPFYAATDTTFSRRTLSSSRLAFLFTDLEHNDVLAKRETFRLFLETSDLPKLSHTKR